MSALCGAMWLGDGQADEMLRGVTDALGPYGTASMWSGDLGGWKAALCAVDPDEVGPARTMSGCDRVRGCGAARPTGPPNQSWRRCKCDGLRADRHGLRQVGP